MPNSCWKSPFREGRVLDMWKQAIVLPLKKNPTADGNLLENLRPVSLLPYFSKIAEKVVKSHLVAHINKHNLVHPTQSGFRSTYSTESALLYATEIVRRRVDEGLITVLVLLDLSAAFDTVSHELLLHRLKRGGFGWCCP